MIMNGQLDIELFYESVEQWEGVRVRATNDRWKTGVSGVLEGLPNARLVILHRDVAAAQWGDAGVFKFPGDRAALFGRALQGQVEILNGDVIQVDPSDRLDGVTERHLSQGVRGNPD